MPHLICIITLHFLIGCVLAFKKSLNHVLLPAFPCGSRSQQKNHKHIFSALMYHELSELMGFRTSGASAPRGFLEEDDYPPLACARCGNREDCERALVFQCPLLEEEM
jgi:hypothetical protein